MNSARRHSLLAARRTQRGFSFLELIVAVTIALFMAVGLFSLLFSLGRTYQGQNSIAGVEDSARVAMTMITNVVQEAGWYPNALPSMTAGTNLNVPTNQFSTVSGSSLANVGQVISGTGTGTGTGTSSDTLSVQYFTGIIPSASAPDGLLNCQGATNSNASTPVASPVNVLNTFSVDANSNLVCSVNGATAVPLVSNVNSFKVLYGVAGAGTTGAALAATGTPGYSSVSFYKTASQMTANDWTTVESVQVTIIFNNPLATNQAGQTQAGVTTSGQTQAGQNPTISFTQTIALLNKI